MHRPTYTETSLFMVMLEDFTDLQLFSIVLAAILNLQRYVIGIGGGRTEVFISDTHLKKIGTVGLQ